MRVQEELLDAWRARERGARTPDRNQHYDSCDGLRCPCYLEGQRDLAEAIRIMQRHGLPIDDVLAVPDA